MKSKKINFVKYFLFVLVFIFTVIFFTNFVVSYTHNKIISLMNSDQFDNFIVQRLNQKLEKLSDKEFTQSEIDYYSRIYNKLKKKIDPIVNN